MTEMKLLPHRSFRILPNLDFFMPNFFEKLFGPGKKEGSGSPAIPFGRYSDNNKTIEKVNRWTLADNLFKEKKFNESLDAFFDYLRDDNEQNVTWDRKGDDAKFQVFQGSKIVRGTVSENHLVAEVSLAKMPQLNIPVMRRLLEMNFNMYYCRFALDGERLCMRFDTTISTANPNKLYYGLKELATRADKQDDLLVQDFASLQPLDTEHVVEISQAEKQVKFDFIRQTITETLQTVQALDPDKFSGAISYLLLGLLFRIDYLVVPDGKLLLDIERIVDAYFKKEDKPATEKNQLMLEAIRKIEQKPATEVFPCLLRTRHTFSVVTPQPFKAVSDAVSAALQNMTWYRDNGYTQIASRVIEYGISFPQYSYSLPKPVTALIGLFMHVNYSAYFQSLGFSEKYYDPATERFNPELVLETIRTLLQPWKTKFPKMEFNSASLQFGNLLRFNISFAEELAKLNLDS